MQIRVFRTFEVSHSIYRIILSHLRKMPGPAQYAGSNFAPEWDWSELGYRNGEPCLSRQAIWDKCRYCRTENRMNDDTVVVVITDYPADDDCFMAGDGGGTRNFFISTADMESLPEISDRVYPVVHQLATISLLVAAYNDYNEVVRESHRDPRGCYMDLGIPKKYLHLKMKTADICSDCRKYLAETKVDPALLRQVYMIFEDVRDRMYFRERFELLEIPSAMEVNEQRMTLLFTSVNPRPVKLTPQEMTVYLFFLNHHRGEYFNRLGLYREELVKMYRRLSDKVEVDALENSIDNMIANTRTILNPVITKINRKITKAVGNQIDKYYQIIGGGKKHRIAIDPQYVTRVNRVSVGLFREY